MTKIEELMKKNQDLFNKSKSELLVQQANKRLLEENADFDKQRYEEEGKMKGHLISTFNNLNEEERNKVDTDNIQFSRLQELYKEKIEGLDKNNPSYLADLFKLESFYSKSINKRLNDLESLINNAAERRMAQENLSDKENKLYLILRHDRLKERKQFLDKEAEFLAKQREDLAKKETPTEFVESLSHTEMPSYTDPED